MGGGDSGRGIGGGGGQYDGRSTLPSSSTTNTTTTPCAGQALMEALNDDPFSRLRSSIDSPWLVQMNSLLDMARKSALDSHLVS